MQRRIDSFHVIVTCYDCPTARILSRTNVDVIFVGDSLGTNVLGYESPAQVTMADMLHHVRAVRRGTTDKPIMADLPFGAFATPDRALRNAQALRDCGADVVKLEGGRAVEDVVRHLVGAGLSVVGHIGHTPQTYRGGPHVTATTEESAIDLLHDALALERAGASAIVLECVPEPVAREITSRLRTPTIGIGAGRFTTGQVLVFHDLVGLNPARYRFAKRYADLDASIHDAVNRFADDVRAGRFPTEEHTFRIKAERLAAFQAMLDGP